MSVLRQIFELPVPARLTILFYFCHLICANWIATSEGFLVLSAICWGIAVRKSQLPLTWSRVYLPMVLFIAGSLLSTVFAPDPLWSLTQASEPLLFLGFPIGLSIYTSLSESFRSTGFRIMVTVATGASSWALFQFFVMGWNDLDHRIRGPASHVMTFSGIILVVSLMLLAHVVGHRRWVLVPALGIILLALTLTYTRGAWIGWLAGAAYIALRRRPYAIAFLVPLILIGLLAAPMSVFGRVTSVFDPELSSNLDRIRMAQAGVEMIRDRPILGNGPGHMEEVYPFYRADDAPRFRTPHLHSNPFQIWAERGLVAFLAYHLLILIVVGELWRRRKTDPTYADAGVAATLAFFLAGLTEFNFGDGEVLMSWLAVVALCLGAFEPVRPAEPAGVVHDP